MSYLPCLLQRLIDKKIGFYRFHSFTSQRKRELDIQLPLFLSKGQGEPLLCGEKLSGRRSFRQTSAGSFR